MAMPGRGEIETYHNEVASDIKPILGKFVTFYPPDDAPEGTKWYKCHADSGVEFDLVPVDPTESEPATRMRREGGPIHRVSVFPLFGPSSPYLGMFWASWHENWWKQNTTNFVLVSAGWTLFEGLPGNQDKNQVLRADWDQLTDKRSKRAGHPHWHFDHELFISDEPDKIEVAPGLYQVATEGTTTMNKAISVGVIHLAMGAWDKDAVHPQCWQRDYEDNCQLLRDWCVKTLRYLKEQVGGG